MLEEKETWLAKEVFDNTGQAMTHLFSKSICWTETSISAGWRVPFIVKFELGGLGRSLADTAVGVLSASMISH